MEWILAALIVCTTLTACGRTESPKERLLALHNRERVQRNLAPLALDESLCKYAQKHAGSMADRGRLAHSSMSDLSASAGNGNVGENIAWGQDSEEDATDSWMNSTGHRQNILGKRFKRVGFGMKRDKNGRPYWCSVFAD